MAWWSSLPHWHVVHLFIHARALCLPFSPTMHCLLSARLTSMSSPILLSSTSMVFVPGVSSSSPSISAVTLLPAVFLEEEEEEEEMAVFGHFGDSGHILPLHTHGGQTFWHGTCRLSSCILISIYLSCILPSSLSFPTILPVTCLLLPLPLFIQLCLILHAPLPQHLPACIRFYLGSV